MPLFMTNDPLILVVSPRLSDSLSRRGYVEVAGIVAVADIHPGH